MNAATIKQQLHGYLEVADEKKLKAIHTMVEDEIKEASVDYTPALKEELDRRVNAYLSGQKTVSPKEMGKRLQSIRNKRK